MSHLNSRAQRRERGSLGVTAVQFGMARRSLRATSGVILAAAGMGTLCLGFKLPALGLFAIGVSQIEQDWRARHAAFRGGIGARWGRALEFYAASHQNPTNRHLARHRHPVDLGGAGGLFAAAPVFGPVWLGSLAAFGVGWLLNLVGHSAFEKRAPAFSEDALSFLAGPVWDLRQLFERTSRRASE
ncbi:MAG: Mpo1-like protein [Myxococcales bacterium]